jgi:hypothetical protein
MRAYHETPPTLDRYAMNASMSANPGLWDGLFAAYVPVLGMPGSLLADLSGKGNPAAFASPAWGMGPVGPVASMTTGVTNYLIAQDTPAQRVSEVSITVWFRNRTSEAHYSTLALKMYNNQSGPPYNNYGFEWNTTSLQFDLSPGGSFHSCSLVDWGIVNGHNFGVLTGTYSQTAGARVYINGALVLTDAGVTGALSGYASTGNQLVIGGGGGTGGVNPSVNIDLAAALFHNRPLASLEVAALASDPLLPFRLRRRTGGRGTAAHYMWWMQQQSQLIGGGIAA